MTKIQLINFLIQFLFNSKLRVTLRQLIDIPRVTSGTPPATYGLFGSFSVLAPSDQRALLFGQTWQRSIAGNSRHVY